MDIDLCKIQRKIERVVHAINTVGLVTHGSGVSGLHQGYVDLEPCSDGSSLGIGSDAAIQASS